MWWTPPASTRGSAGKEISIPGVLLSFPNLADGKMLGSVVSMPLCPEGGIYSRMADSPIKLAGEAFPLGGMKEAEILDSARA